MADLDIKQRLLRLMRTDAALTLLFALVYFQLIWGLSIVNPRHFSWMLAITDDLTLYLTTTNYFRFSSWQFPLTAFDSLFYPTGANIALADGVPLFAIPFKLLDPILPREVLQYFGLWLLFCTWLQALLAKSIFRTLGLPTLWQWAGTLLVVSDLPLVFEVWHGALWAHWTFLFGFYLFFLPTLAPRRAILLAGIMPWIHPYLLAMVCATLLATFIRHRSSPLVWRTAFLSVVAMLLSAWVVGYASFAASPKLAVTHLVFDLVGFFDGAGASTILPNAIPAVPILDDGFGYLGLGGIALFVLLLARPFLRRLRLPPLGIAPLLIVCLLMALYSLGPDPHFRGEPIGAPAFIAQLVEPFTSRLRVTGRFMWPLWHLVMILGVVTLHQIFRGRAWANATVAAVVALQLLDVGPWLVKVNETRLTHAELEPVPEQVRAQLTPESKLLLFHYDSFCKPNSPRYRGTWPIAFFGAVNGLRTNSDFHALARPLSFREVCNYTKKMWKHRNEHPEAIFVDRRLVPP